MNSCSNEEENIFDESSANRIETALKVDKEILMGAPNGWIMEYYPSKTQAYGGYTVLVSFGENDKVTVASDASGASGATDPKATATSLYGLIQSAGPVLTFNTHNEIFHFFSDPKNEAGLGNVGKGMEGDYEFLIMEASAEKVRLKGIKTGNSIIMTPMPTNKTWEDYLSELSVANENMIFNSFEYQVNDQNIATVSSSYRTLTFAYTENDLAVSKTFAYIVTPTGYKFYSPINLGGVEVSELIFHQEGDNCYFTASNNIKARLNIAPISQQLVSGNWYFAYSKLGSFGKSYWDYAKTNGLDKIGEELYYGYLGKSKDGEYGFNFASYDGSSLYPGVLIYKYTLIKEDQITLSQTSAAGDGRWYFNNAKFNYLINPIGLSEGRTFTLTTDDKMRPTWIKLTDNSNANNIITLYKSRIYWPFDN